MGKRNLNSKPAALMGKAGGQSVERNRRLALPVARHLYLAPTDCAGSLKRLHRLVYRLLCRDPGSGMPGCVGAGGQVIPLSVREKTGHRLFPLPVQQGSYPLQVDQIYSDAYDRHRLDHQSSASGRSTGGTDRYPPSTSPK